ncbi:MAG: YjjG family noncanonical pyrimidine nucleotidase [Acidimicrobiia bacterium]
MPYSTLLFDLDHTLFDSDASEAAAFDTTMRAVGFDEPFTHFEAYQRINLDLWAGVERGEVRPIDVRRVRFERLFAELKVDASVEEMAALFVHSLGANGDLYPGVIELLDRLKPHARLGLVTNGLSDVQRARLARLGIADRFDAVVISSEVGVTKPRREIFDIAFERLGAPATESALMIGDSLTSDIAGGANYGIATCWYNPQGRMRAPEDIVTHEIADLGDLIPIVTENVRGG